MDDYLRKQFQDDLWVLSDMEATFVQWYPQHFDFLSEEEQEKLSPSELKEAKDQFSRTKLNLELGEYGPEDYGYLQWLLNRVLDNEQYFEAVNSLVYVLSEEYGP